MKAKKILAGVCASMMLAATTIPNVLAAGVNLTVGSAKAKAGETFSVKVDLAPASGSKINGCDFGIKYDSSVITITGVEKGELAKDDTDSLDGVKSLETNIESGLVSIVYGVSGTAIDGSGTFVTLTGKVNASAKAGDKSALEVVAIDRPAKSTGTDKNTDIIIGYLEDDNKTFTNYTPTIVNGVVEVEGTSESTTTPPTDEPTTPPTDKPTTPPTDEPATPPTDKPTDGGNINPAKVSKLGDVDLNGLVELNDIIVLAKHLLNATSNPLNDEQKANADVTKDGAVNSADLSKIIEHNLNPVGVPIE
jgi:hypothetical protein